MKYLVLAAILFVVGIALTQLERESNVFTPLIRIRTESGLFLTMVQSQTTKRSACTEAVEQMVRAFTKVCAACFVESTECATKLVGVDRALSANDRLPVYTITGEGFRIGILGPPSTVQAQCETMASRMVQSGLKRTACVPPVSSL